MIHLDEFNLDLAVIALPGHTLGHVAYYSRNTGENFVFCGDTLFGAGCGRLFEGTRCKCILPYKNWRRYLLTTKVYCTHEYTLHNINFALSLEPNNQALLERQQETLRLRNLQLPSLPSTIALELATNPFLRCHSTEIQSSIQLTNATPLQVFSTVREMRNHY